MDAMDLCGLSMTALHRPAFVTGNVTWQEKLLILRQKAGWVGLPHWMEICSSVSSLENGKGSSNICGC